MTIYTWTILEVSQADVPEDVYTELSAVKPDDGVNRIHGGYEDLFIRHGDDGGWCADLDEEGPAYAWLEETRKQHDMPDAGQVFYVLICTT